MSVKYLLTLDSIREQSNKVYSLAQQDKLEFWSLDLSKQDSIIDFVCQLIKRDYGTDYDSIPPHGRCRHFLGRLDSLTAKWEGNVAEYEIAKRLVDLVVVSVLVDAGAGPTWAFTAKDGSTISRSEGLAVASLEMFENGVFSSDPSNPYQVDAVALSRITTQQISDAFQVSAANPMTGLDGRASLLINLASALSSKAYFSSPTGVNRPGNMLDYLASLSSTTQTPSAATTKLAVPIDSLWEVIIKGFASIWPQEGRTRIDGISVGDVWPLEVLGGEHVSFHKLSQWLTYSLIEVIETTLHWSFPGKEKMTGLPEYRNGGLLIDYSLLTPKYPALLESLSLPSSTPHDLLQLPAFAPSHPFIIQLRSLTVISLDKIKEGINKKLGVDLSLVQVLEAGTWKAGREAAKAKREGGGPPFNLISDGTVF